MSSVLKLNATYEPLDAVPVRRAINLVLSGKATVLEESDKTWGSENLRINIPTVIKMNYMVKVPRRSRVKLTRATIMARDKHQCQFIINGQACGRRGDTMDHVKPRSKGGKHEWTNVVAACGRCNARKADKTLEQMGWELRRQPTVPVGNDWILNSLLAKGDNPDWKEYVEAHLTQGRS